MSIFKILLILFITIPLLELYLLIEIGSALGVLETIMLCVLTALIGTFLLRLQGLQTIADIQTKLNRKEVPAADLASGAILLLSGALLLTPGFFTDVIGFLCLVPSLRKKIAAKLLMHLLESRVSGSQTSVIVEGEYWDEDQDKKRLH